MSIIKINLVGLVLGLSLVASQVQAFPLHCVKTNSLAYKYGVPAAKVLTTINNSKALKMIKIPMAAFAKIIKAGAIKFDSRYRSELVKSPYLMAAANGYVMLVGSYIVGCVVVAIAEERCKAIRQARENRAWKKEVLRKAKEAKDCGCGYVDIR